MSTLTVHGKEYRLILLSGRYDTEWMVFDGNVLIEEGRSGFGYINGGDQSARQAARQRIIRRNKRIADTFRDLCATLEDPLAPECEQREEAPSDGN